MMKIQAVFIIELLRLLGNQYACSELRKMCYLFLANVYTCHFACVCLYDMICPVLCKFHGNTLFSIDSRQTNVLRQSKIFSCLSRRAQRICFFLLVERITSYIFIGYKCKKETYLLFLC